MKANLIYECNEPGHEQKLTVTATGDFDTPGGNIEMTMEFDPPCSDDTSDPTGMLHVVIQTFQQFKEARTDSQSGSAFPN